MRTFRRLSLRLISRLHRTRRAAQRGMTLLEIMIVLAILALVMGLVVGPRVMKMFASSKVSITQAKVEDIAFTAFGQWQAAHPDKGCPASLADLNNYMNNPDTNDAWEHPLKFFCGQNLPAGAKGGFAVMSLGEDGKEGTCDDIESWDHKHAESCGEK